MNITKAILSAAMMSLPAFLPVALHATGAPGVQVNGTDDGGSQVSFPNGQAFTLDGGKGLLGPVCQSTDGTVVAVNYQMCVGCCDLHLYLTGRDGKITEIQDVNNKIATANPAGTKGDPGFFEAIKISGRVIEVAGYHNEFPNFKIKVARDGAITLVR